MGMKLRVNELVEGPNAFVFQSGKDAWLKALGENLSKVGPGPAEDLSLGAEITKLEPDYVLRGKLQFEVKLSCDRCAEKFGLPINHRFELAFARAKALKSEGILPEEKTESQQEQLDVVPFANIHNGVN